jgi:hypothetical protein
MSPGAGGQARSISDNVITFAYLVNDDISKAYAEFRGSASPVWRVPDAWHTLVDIFISYEFNAINA